MGTRLGRYLSRDSDGETQLPPHEYDDQTFVSRLSFKGREFVVSHSAVAETIARIPSDGDIYLDANMWDVSVADQMWSALTTTEARVRVTPFVFMELRRWAKTHSRHAGVLGFCGDPSALEVELPNEEGSPAEISESYYTYLLWVRRSARKVAIDQLSKAGRATPTDREISNHTQKMFGERGLQLVYKRGHLQSSETPTDENLVFRAAANAVRSGRHTVVISADEDVLEQFYKLWWFLDTHYRAMLLGQEYLRDPLAYRHHALPDAPRNRDMVDFDTATIVQRGTRRMSAVLPDNPKIVMAECWIVKPNSMLKWAFAAEQGIAEMLDIKGNTGGRSVDLPGARNLHPWLAGLSVSQERVADSFLVAADKTLQVPGSSARVSIFDAMHSINNHERHSKIVRGPSVSSRLWTPTY